MQEIICIYSYQYMFFQPHFLHFMTMNSVLVKHCHSATLNIMLICPKF